MSNATKNSELNIIQKYLNSQSGNVLLFSNNPELIICSLTDKLHVFSSNEQCISDKIDNFLSTNTFQTELSKYGQKFDTIILHDIFEEIKHPELFLLNLDSFLNNDGSIFCSISNFYHITNIVNLLIGKPLQSNSIIYDLDIIISIVNKINMHLDKIFRIHKDFLHEETNIDETLIPQKLIDMIKKIPDHDVSQYVLMIGKNKTIPSENLEFVSQFPKNYLLPKLQNFFDEFTELEKSVSNKDTLISGLENSIKEQKDYTESTLSNKDTLISGLENSIKEQKKLIQGHENSIKEQKDYTESTLSNKDTLISGLENSIKEQKDYIENLSEHIRNLELQLKKLKFWKR
jgi:hypothetical protein